MRVVNPNPRVPKAALVNLLQAHMQGKTSQDFNEIRGALPLLADLADGEIEQLAEDAGFPVEGGPAPVDDGE